MGEDNSSPTKSTRKSKYPSMAWVKCLINKGMFSNEVSASDVNMGDRFLMFVNKVLLKENQEYEPKIDENKSDWVKVTIIGYNAQQKKYIGVLPQPNIVGSTNVFFNKDEVDFIKEDA